MSEGDVSLACVWVVIDELVRAGLTDACLSPGSRSTPIALALGRHPRVRVHVHLDERASAFFALGLAKATGRVVAVACTSGTAAANLFPAVIEASMSRVPLVLLTADRPTEVRGTGANQTIDQIELYGRYVRWFEDARVPGDRPELAYWRSLAAEAVRAATGVPSGPVHLNLPFREPLVPEARKPAPASVAARGTSRIELRRARDDQIEELASEVSRVERGLVVAGSLRQDAASVLALARRAGWPLIAEPTSGLRVPGALASGQFLVASEAFARGHEPDLVLQYGAAPTSRAGLALVAAAGRLVIVDPDRQVADPARHASPRLEVDAEELSSALSDRLGRTPQRSSWLDAWLRADAIATEVVGDLLDSWTEPFEGRVARDLAAAIPDGGTLVVGSSMPVRDLDMFMWPRDGIRVVGNRGASGIDGFVSTALGVAAAGAPTYALCGDLTLLHDGGSLLWSSTRGLDAVFVVINNNGGVIFSFLPQRELPEFQELFVTPHGLDLAKLAAAAGAGHALVEKAADFIPAVEKAVASRGVQVIEVPSDRERNVARHAEIQEAIGAALTASAR